MQPQSTPSLDPAQLLNRLAAKIAVDASGCWIWGGSLSQSGYGVMTFQAHRLAYELLVADVPAGLVLDHLCRVRHCVNPAHLEPVTIGENVLRGLTIPTMHRAKTRCPKGHEYTPENTRADNGMRFCRQCHRDRERARYHRESGAEVRKRNRHAQDARIAAGGPRTLPQIWYDFTGACPLCGKSLAYQQEPPEFGFPLRHATCGGFARHRWLVGKRRMRLLPSDD